MILGGAALLAAVCAIALVVVIRIREKKNVQA